MHFPQTVSPELADRDFLRISAEFEAGMQSLFVPEARMSLNSRRYSGRKSQCINDLRVVAGQSGFELVSQFANQSLFGDFETIRRTFDDAPPMHFRQTVSPELPDRDFRRFKPDFAEKSRSQFAPRAHMSLTSRRNFDGKSLFISSLEFVAENSGNKLRLTIANQSLLANYGTIIRTFADARPMLFLQTVSPKMADRDFRRFGAYFAPKSPSQFAPEACRSLISRRYIDEKSFYINGLTVVAGQSGFELVS